jgi:glycosyltransferase involved in cell wall biosynthesis
VEARRPGLAVRDGGAPDDAAAAGCTLLVDGRGLCQSGIGRYLREVLTRLVRDPRFARIVLVAKAHEAAEWLAAQGEPPHVRVVPFARHFYSAAGQARWAALARAGTLDADVAFFPHYDVPLRTGPARVVVCVQDLNHFKLPALFPAWKRLVAAVVLRRAVARAARVIVPSASTRADLLERFPGAERRIDVVPHGASPPPAVGHADTLRKVEDLRPFLLCVGNRKPHKNFRTAVEVLARLRTDDPSLRLVVVGKADDDEDGVRETAGRLGVQDAVVEPGSVTDAELAALYAAAECLLAPSLYEGFGLTPLEAMHAGTPVVVSSRASLPEVVGDAGLVVDPLDVDGMAAAVERLRTDVELRAGLVARGRARAAAFTWDAAARRTADLLWDAAGRTAGS